MKISAREAHIVNDMSRIETIQDIGELLSVLRLDALLGVVVEEVFQPFVSEAFDHRLSVTHKVTFMQAYFSPTDEIRPYTTVARNDGSVV